MRNLTHPKKAWLIIGLWLLLLAVLAPGLSKLAFVNDYKVFFSDDNPDLVAFEYIEEKYSSNDSVLVVIGSTEGDVFNPQALTAVRELTEQAWHTPYSYRVDSLTNYQYTRADGDDLLVEDLFDDVTVRQPDVISSRGLYATNQPELVNRLVSADGRVTAINVLGPVHTNSVVAVVTKKPPI
jgi:predicted RND superfamily exporter protein